MNDQIAAPDRRAGPPAGQLDFLAPIVRQSGFIIVFALSAIATALSLTYVYSEKYESTTAVSYRVQEVTRFNPQQNAAMGSPAPAAPFRVIGQTLQEVLKSDAILRDVVLALKLDEERAVSFEGPWYLVWYRRTKEWVKEYGGYAWKLLKYGRIVEEDPVASAIGQLRNNIKVTNRDSYVFNLHVRDNYPDRAAAIANHLGKVLADWLLEFDRQPGRSRADQLRELLDAKAVALAARRREIQSLLTSNNLVSVQQETERLTDQLYALRLEESRLASEVAQAESRQASVQSKLAIKRRILSAPVPAVAVAPAQAPLPPIAVARAQQQSVPQPVAVAGLAAAAQALAGDEFIQPEDFKKLASQGLFDEIEVGSLRAKRASLQDSIARITQRLRGLPAIQTRLDGLKLSLDALERDYALLNDGYQEAAVRASSPVSEVFVLHPATVPTSPVGPIKVYHVLLAGGLGLLFALGLVYLLDFLNIRILFASRGPAWRAPPAAVPKDPAPIEPTMTNEKDVASNG